MKRRGARGTAILGSIVLVSAAGAVAGAPDPPVSAAVPPAEPAAAPAAPEGGAPLSFEQAFALAAAENLAHG